MIKTYGNRFYGFDISEYGVKNGFVDYGTLSKAVGDCILNNTIYDACYGDFGIISGCDYDRETEEFVDVFQYYIVSERGAELLQDVGEIVYYNQFLDLYLWGITHFGTGWDYVLTNIPITSESEFLEQFNK